MSKKVVIVSLSLTTLLALFVLKPSEPAHSADVEATFVTNLESPHPVTGEVGVEGLIRHGQLVEMRDLIVSPARREETNLLTDAGVVEVDGFTAVTLSLQGEIKGNPFRPGAVGALLLPEEDPFREAFLQRGELHLPLETSTEVHTGASSSFSSSQPHLPIGFPRYRVLLYNETDKTANVNLYAYLTY